MVVHMVGVGSRHIELPDMPMYPDNLIRPVNGGLAP
jgi:hypothetical protein